MESNSDTFKPDFSPEWIEWNDHCSLSGGGWREASDWEQLGPLRIVSIGFVVRETEDVVVVVPHYTNSDTGCGDMCILKSDIVLRRPLEVE